jgi:hypothetical protein
MNIYVTCSNGYSPLQTFARLNRYCLRNGNRLKRLLTAADVATLVNPDSVITVLEQLPPWTIQDFHVGPEGDWLHYLTMPHISPTAVDHFVKTIAALDVHFRATFAYFLPSLTLALGRSLRLRRVKCQRPPVS